MRNLLSLAWRDLRGGGRTLWVFCACLTLGVALIAASGGLYRQVSASLLADTRALFGGDLEVRVRAPLAEDMLEWMRARGAVSRLIEFRTMLITDTGEAQLVELQSVDDAYPFVRHAALRARARLWPKRPPSAMGATVWYSTACWPSDWP